MSKTNYELWLHGWHFELQHGFETNNDSALCKNMWHVYRQTYMYSICNITSQLWHIFILSDYYHAIHIVYIHAFLLQMYTSAPIATQMQLWCSRPQRSPREIELTVHLTVQCLNMFEPYQKIWKDVKTIAQSGTLCQSDVTQVSWFLIQNSALYT